MNLVLESVLLLSVVSELAAMTEPTSPQPSPDQLAAQRKKKRWIVGAFAFVTSIVVGIGQWADAGKKVRDFCFADSKAPTPAAAPTPGPVINVNPTITVSPSFQNYPPQPSTSAGQLKGGSSPATAETVVPTNGIAEPVPAQAPDPCKGAGNCYAGDAFVADVARVTTSRPRAGPVNATVIHRVDVRFRNVTTKPITLAHRSDKAVMIDNNGNRYWYWNDKVNVTGIGLVWNSGVDTSFVIRPNESRNATFEQRLVYDSRQKAPGSSITFDLEIDEVDMMPNRPVRIVRKNAVGFRDLST